LQEKGSPDATFSRNRFHSISRPKAMIKLMRKKCNHLTKKWIPEEARASFFLFDTVGRNLYIAPQKMMNLI
jgi:hypothetical protein